MYSTVEDSAGPAVKCHLYELPSTLVYEVTKKLDVSSQRSLFLSSLQLYKLWHLQISEEDHEWHFLSWSLDTLAQSSSQTCCDMWVDRTFIEANFQAIKINCCPDQQHNKFATSLTSYNRVPDAFIGSLMKPMHFHQGLLTKEQVLKRCISSPGLVGSTLALTSKDTANQQELRALAHRVFSLLHEQKGLVGFDFAGQNLLVTHLQDGWKIDLKPCSVSPPVIDLITCTEGESDLERVWARLSSRGSLASIHLLGIDSTSWLFD